jgi:hypothetical protein
MEAVMARSKIDRVEVVALSRHAEARMRQRGLKLNIVQAIASLSDRAVAVGCGCTALTVSRSRLAELRADGVPPALIESLERNMLVEGEDGSIVTVAKQFNGWRARWYRHGRR